MKFIFSKNSQVLPESKKKQTVVTQSKIFIKFPWKFKNSDNVDIHLGSQNIYYKYKNNENVLKLLQISNFNKLNI